VGQNPAALLDVVKGAFALGVHYMSFYSADTDLVRITGYLVGTLDRFNNGKRAEERDRVKHSV
jgi:hypothetical protein